MQIAVHPETMLSCRHLAELVPNSLPIAGVVFHNFCSCVITPVPCYTGRGIGISQSTSRKFTGVVLSAGVSVWNNPESVILVSVIAVLVFVKMVHSIDLLSCDSGIGTNIAGSVGNCDSIKQSSVTCGSSLNVPLSYDRFNLQSTNSDFCSSCSDADAVLTRKIMA